MMMFELQTYKGQQQPFASGFSFYFGRITLVLGYSFFRYFKACSSIF